ncbi:MAG: C25 family cysteine peptidase, partial [Sphingobacteriia bacterium]|nr:C25 family cysteine peptidase [Sphingobacteriia bacterium]
GHGGELGWTSEGVLVYSDIMKWKQIDKLPLFITATCEFSRFDDPSLTSAGELVLLNPDGGGIGLLTTTRLAYSSSNSMLHQALFKDIFAEDQSGYNLRLGDIIRQGKNKTGNTLNLRNFTLLGDPALRIAFPENQVKLLTINGTTAPAFEDTLVAMKPVHLTGRIIIKSNELLGDFNGKLIYRFFDKPVNSTLLGNDKESTVYPFKVTDRLLIEGQAQVVNGEFDFSFLPPSTMNLALGKPLINFYAYDSLTDARGMFKNFWFEGVDPDALTDNNAPVIKAWINNKSFINGDVVAPSGSIFLAELSDDFGINAAGSTIGRDIIAVIDGNFSDPNVLNSFYQSGLNDYKSGNIAWMMPDLSEGTHTITLRAWDYNGNSSEVTLTFVVASESAILQISSVTVFPNPFSSEVSIVVNHNLPGQDINATIEVYDLTGRVVYRETQEFKQAGSALTPFIWNGKNGVGAALPDGFYPTRVILKSDKWIQRAGFNLLKVSH